MGEHEAALRVLALYLGDIKAAEAYCEQHTGQAGYLALLSMLLAPGEGRAPLYAEACQLLAAQGTFYLVSYTLYLHSGLGLRGLRQLQGSVAPACSRLLAVQPSFLTGNWLLRAQACGVGPSHQGRYKRFTYLQEETHALGLRGLRQLQGSVAPA